jgi:hypothetical protein
MSQTTMPLAEFEKHPGHTYKHLIDASSIVLKITMAGA